MKFYNMHHARVLLHEVYTATSLPVRHA